MLWLNSVLILFSMDKDRINSIGLLAQTAIMRTQLDALIDLLKTDERELFDKLTIEQVSKVYSVYEKKLNEEEFKFFRDLVEDGLFRK